MEYSRREFVRSGAAGALGLAGRAVFAAPGEEGKGGKSEVFVGKGKAEKTIPALLEKMGGMGRFVKKGARVVIKPNMSFTNPPEMATTTSPEAVRTVAELCLRAGARRIIVCDNTIREAAICREKSGIEAGVKDLKGVVVYTPKRETQYEERTDEQARELSRVMLVKEALRADALIALPVAKSHSAGGVSLGIKGMMGLVKERGVMHAEMDLHRAIAELLYYVKPHLSIIDAGRALLDNGPAGPGTVKQLETYVAGVDPVAVDSFGVSLASWYGRRFEGTQVAHINYAGEMGFGNVESSKIAEVSI